MDKNDISRAVCKIVGFKSRKLGGVGLAVLLGWTLFKTILYSIRVRESRVKIEKKQESIKKRKQQLEKSLTDKNGELMNEKRENILKLDIKELLAQLRCDKLDPVHVLQAYQARALIVDKRLNAVCDFVLEATKWAENLRKVPVGQRGALYGLPISVKECFWIKGYDSTAGLAKRIDQPSQEDGAFVKFLKDQHGIPFCQTNISQTMLSYGCSNPVFGNTSNPHDLSRTPGGSSGGESALIASGGSILGIGTDVGGSLRIPAHFCGLAALKPTSRRIYQGGRLGGPGKETIALRPILESVAGFLASEVEGVKLGMELLLKNTQRMCSDDFRVAPVPWQEDLYSTDRKLCIGWYDDDGVFPCTPGCKRAVRLAVDKLQEAGHTVKQLKNSDMSVFYQSYFDFMLSDSGYNVLKSWQGEVLDKAIQANAMKLKTPDIARPLISFVWSLISKKLQQVFDARITRSRDLWTVNATVDCHMEQLYTAWQEEEFDVVICPGFSYPAPSPSSVSWLIPGVSYTAVFNTIQNPVGLVPVTRENEEDQAALEEYPKDEDYCYKLAYLETKGALGCPIGVQVIGRPFQEELVLNVMEKIEALVDYDKSISF